MQEHKCTHHWMIDNELLGRCRKCGEIKDFRALQKEAHDKFITKQRGTV